ncbi:MAG: U32 family peptidase [Lachnospiraceae bacterium]|nr:U32 family peptidase [Lachnospiraceae bacterium]
MIELLSPAGDYSCFMAALSAGADAIYAGLGRFSARAYAGNLSEEEFLKAMDYCHLLGKKVYLTLNTLIKESELKPALDLLRPLYQAGLDGVIIQDIGLLKLIKENLPLLPIHMSTQSAVTGAAGARLFKALGCKRLILPRELTLSDIKKIHEGSDIELECFIHGAMCYSVSGLCLMSSFFGGRSGNRGRCAGPCRQPYRYPVPGKGSRKKAKKSEESPAYYLSMKDLCTLPILPEIISSGVASLKIEGRMKSPSYVYFVTQMYRKYLDLYMESPENYRVDKGDLDRTIAQYSRSGYSDGYFKKKNGPDMITLERGSYISEKNSAPVASPPTLEIEGAFKGHIGEPIELSIKYNNRNIRALGPTPQKAIKNPVPFPVLDKQLRSTGGSPFTFSSLMINADPDIFISKSGLNELRRDALFKLKEELLSEYRRAI